MTVAQFLIVSGIMLQAYIILHWNPDKLEHKVMALRLRSLVEGFLARAKNEEQEIDDARTRALFDRAEAENRPPVGFFQPQLYLDDEWVLGKTFDEEQKMAVSD